MFRVNVECYVAVIRVRKAYVNFPFLYEITTKLFVIVRSMMDSCPLKLMKVGVLPLLAQLRPKMLKRSIRSSPRL